MIDKGDDHIPKEQKPLAGTGMGHIELPDALPTQTAALLVGFAPQRIHKLIKEKALHGITVRAVQYISKSEFIAYISSPKRFASVKNETYKSLMRRFKKNDSFDDSR